MGKFMRLQSIKIVREFENFQIIHAAPCERRYNYLLMKAS